MWPIAMFVGGIEGVIAGGLGVVVASLIKKESA